MRQTSPKVFHVYITASKPRGVLYVGMTSDLAGRAWQHREHVREGFTKRYWVDRFGVFRAA
jgi:putative endonuclease